MRSQALKNIAHFFFGKSDCHSSYICSRIFKILAIHEGSEIVDVPRPLCFVRKSAKEQKDMESQKLKPFI